MAVPMAENSVQTAAEYQLDRARAAPYSLRQAFAFVFRGRGLYVFGSYLVALVVLAILGLLPVVGVGAGCFSAVFVLSVLLLVPGMLAKIVRDSAAGENELSDWPDLSEFGERFGEIVGFVLSGLLAALPLVLALKLGGCVEGGTFGAHCWLVLFGGWFLTMALWIPAFGAVSLSHNNFVALRLDGHLKVLARFGSELWLIVLLATVLVVAGQVLSIMLSGVPLIGLVGSAAVGMYGWFTAAHLIGIFFRRNARELRNIYREW